MRYKDNRGWQMYDYFQWLCEKIECPESADHSLLLKDLHAMVFEYKLPRDENRAKDGVELRRQYMDEEGIDDRRYFDDSECSFLEMLIAMCEDFAYDTVGKEFAPASYWFWAIMDNLDLTREYDECYHPAYVEQQVNNVIERHYKRNGDGGMFPLKYPPSDQRRTEIWKQMNLWFTERAEYGPLKG